MMSPVLCLHTGTLTARMETGSDKPIHYISCHLAEDTANRFCTSSEGNKTISGHRKFLNCKCCVHAFHWKLCCFLWHRSRGFGFVTFEDPKIIDQIQADRPHMIDDKTVDTKRVVPKSVSKL